MPLPVKSMMYTVSLKQAQSQDPRSLPSLEAMPSTLLLQRPSFSLTLPLTFPTKDSPSPLTKEKPPTDTLTHTRSLHPNPCGGCSLQAFLSISRLERGGEVGGPPFQGQVRPAFRSTSPLSSQRFSLRRGSTALSWHRR